MKYDKKLMKDMADNFESYVDIVENYVIIEGITKEEYEWAVKTVKKMIKHLKKGKGEKVFDEKAYAEYIERCDSQ